MEQFFEDGRISSQLRRGPLEPFFNAFAQRLHIAGFSQCWTRHQLRWMADFSLWLRANHLAVDKISERLAAKYLKYRTRKGYAKAGDSAIMKRILVLLRTEAVIAEEEIPEPTPIELAVDEFVLYLLTERALATTTAPKYGCLAKRFLQRRFKEESMDLSVLSSSDVVDFVRQQAKCVHVKEAKYITTALRSFLRYLHYRGYLSANLTAAVPTVAGWSMATIPRSLPLDMVERVLLHCDRRNAAGRRDYAVLLLLARLGLRAGEVASLTLDDIDWQNSCLRIRGKGNHLAQLPLPADVGEAVAAYVLDGRPQTGSRALFLTAKAPHTGFRSQLTVGHIVKRALARAGIKTNRNGAHQFRHSLATQLLSGGASLAEIGELLRHQSPQTTEIYAKVDLPSLRLVAQPWPGGV